MDPLRCSVGQFWLICTSWLVDQKLDVQLVAVDRGQRNIGGNDQKLIFLQFLANYRFQTSVI